MNKDLIVIVSLLLIGVTAMAVHWLVNWGGEIFTEQFWQEEYCSEIFNEKYGQYPIDSSRNMYGQCIYKISEIQKSWIAGHKLKEW